MEILWVGVLNIIYNEPSPSLKIKVHLIYCGASRVVYGGSGPELLAKKSPVHTPQFPLSLMI
ncbi:hypothetical protein SAMN00808754_2566 [Thermanaeromonas toyohensis ToBE]|uniref:Uncharacterized protein n=1 Tax=Thermanaeromonas toyohensis ToBE TaxID=698762 RepID=A0A1W1VZP9_9FIRM|nr:hypothetical protein SAMN00808754_2566 [Thermanaeromonas toyohensis ToBE]